MANDSYVVERNMGEAALWQNRRPFLGRLDMELTERCNNDCIHCCINLPADDQAARERELSTVQIKAILTEAASLGCMTVRYTGGEPLLREDFEELYLFARRLGLRVLLFTNATLVTPHLADLLARIPPLEKIEITVYGMKRKSYEAVSRVPGSFEAAWRGIHLLLERQVPFVVKGALLPPNGGEVDEFDAWAATIPWMGHPPDHAVFFDLRNRRGPEEKNRLIKRLRPSPQEGFAVLARRPESYLKSMKEFCSKFTRPPGDVLFVCGSGQGGGCVDAYGKFQPCMPLRHPETVYDLTFPPSPPAFGGRRGGRGDEGGCLRDALTNFFPKLREMRATNRDYLARCARCFLKGLCRQCPGTSWAEHGTLDTPVEYFCQVAHAQARLLGLIAGGEKAWEVVDWKERIRNFTGKEPIPREKVGAERKACDV